MEVEEGIDRSAGEGPPLDRSSFRLDDVLWVMHCAEGPMPRPASAAVGEFLDKEVRPWRIGWLEDFVGIPWRVKTEGARLLGAAAEDLSLTSTTTSGLAVVAQGLPWRVGDEVLSPLGEFPANAWPWLAQRHRGVELREVPLWEGHRSGADAWTSLPPTAAADPETRLLEALGPRTRILTVSWVRFQDGLRLDLERLAAGCAQRGVILVVDGIQGAGTLPSSLDGLEGICAFATGGHKGLLAPQGLGLLWTSRDFREGLCPPGGWLSVEEATNFDRPSTDLHRTWAQDGSKLEAGVPNLVGCVALAESLALLNGAGISRLEAHILRLQGRLIAGLGDMAGWRGEAERLYDLWQGGRLGSLLSIHHGDRGPAAFQEILRDGLGRGIYASVREGFLRIALHGWHTAEDVDRLLGWLASCADRKRR